MAYHGHGAVALAVDLVQAAGLEARGHEKDIRACLDVVRQRLVVADVQADLLRVLPGGAAQTGFKDTVAAAEHHQLCAALHELRQDLQHQVDAFLLD